MLKQVEMYKQNFSLTPKHFFLEENVWWELKQNVNSRGITKKKSKLNMAPILFLLKHIVIFMRSRDGGW